MAIPNSAMPTTGGLTLIWVSKSVSGTFTNPATNGSDRVAAISAISHVPVDHNWSPSLLARSSKYFHTSNRSSLSASRESTSCLSRSIFADVDELMIASRWQRLGYPRCGRPDTEWYHNRALYHAAAPYELRVGGSRLRGQPPSMSTPAVSLRAAAPDDADFLFQVTEACMRAYAEQTWGAWNEEMTRASFTPPTHRIIRWRDQDIGCLALHEKADHLVLDKPYILPAHQNRGIATRLMRDIISEAAAAGKP